MADASADFSALKKGADLAGMVSMAIPPPAGPILAAGFQIFSSFLPTPQKPDSSVEILDKIAELPSLIIDGEIFSEAKGKLEAINHGLQRVREDWSVAKGTDHELTTLISCRTKFDGLWQVGNSCESILERLLDRDIKDNDPASFTAGRAALASYVALLVGYVIASKTYVELQGGIVGVLQRKQRSGSVNQRGQIREACEQLHTDFDDMTNIVRQYSSPDSDIVKRQDALIASLRAQRPKFPSVQTTGSNRPGFLWQEATFETHRIDDPVAAPEETAGLQFPLKLTDTCHSEYATPGQGRSTPVLIFDCAETQITSKLQSYTDNVVAKFNKAMDDAVQTRTSLAAQLAQIPSIPPENAQDRPTVEWIDVGTPGYWTVPQSSAICWGVQFQSGSATSDVVWSEWSASPGVGKLPKITVPTAQGPSVGSVTRTVYRLVRPQPQNAALQPMADPPDDVILAFMLADNVTDWACDSEPDQALGLPQIPQLAPFCVPAAPAQNSSPLARRYFATYRAPLPQDASGTAPALGASLESPPAASPQTAYLVLAKGNTLQVPLSDRGDCDCVFYTQGIPPAQPTAATGSVAQSADKTMWIYTAG